MAKNKTPRKTFRALAEDMRSLIKSDGNLDSQRARFTRVDKLLEKESDHSEDALKGKRARFQNRKDRLASAEISICQTKKETAHAYLAGTFLNAIPIFAATTDNRQKESAAAQLNVLTKRDQARFSWVSELLRAFDDVLRYNVCPVEVSWHTRFMATAKTQITTGVASTGAVSSIAYEGVRIKRLDPYNTFWDDSVEPHQVARHAAYAGYIESLTRVEVYSRLRELNNDYIYQAHVDIFKGVNKNNSGKIHEGSIPLTFYKPQISALAAPANNGQDFSGYFQGTAKFGTIPEGCHILTTIYTRVIPADLDILADSIDPYAPQIYKCIYIDDAIVYAEPLAQGHELLPIVVGQLYPAPVEKKSFVEYLADLQDLATASMHASLAALRRAVADRALYNPKHISKKDIESTDPTSKIPVDINPYGEVSLDQIYKRIDFVDTVSPQFNNLLGTATALADTAVGINPSSQGSFIPGNKTQTEFQTIMSNSESRLHLGAVQLSNNFLGPIKEILTLNYLVHATSDTITDPDDGQQSRVTIDPAVLREELPQYSLADGVMPASRIANTEVMMQAMATIQNNPQLAMEYDTGGMLISILKQQGLSQLDQYKRSPEEQQAYIQQQQAMMASQQPPTEQPL